MFLHTFSNRHSPQRALHRRRARRAVHARDEQLWSVGFRRVSFVCCVWKKKHTPPLLTLTLALASPLAGATTSLPLASRPRSSDASSPAGGGGARGEKGHIGEWVGGRRAPPWAATVLLCVGVDEERCTRVAGSCPRARHGFELNAKTDANTEGAHKKKVFPFRLPTHTQGAAGSRQAHLSLDTCCAHAARALCAASHNRGPKKNKGHIHTTHTHSWPLPAANASTSASWATTATAASAWWCR